MAADMEIPEAYQGLIEKIDRLADALARAEEKQSEDRDRLLTALMRTHQEVRQLRFELAAQGSRKDRKRRSFLARLLGL